MTWKEQFETETCSSFVKATGDKGESKDKFYYYCNMSGNYTNVANKKRRTKLQGTSKQDAHCTASIVATQDIDGNIHVSVCKTHYGHQLQLGHMRLQPGQRLNIAGQLAQGVEFQHILDKIRDSVSSKFQRIHLITRKDITNIERAYGLRGSEKHKDDATSVKLWVEEMNDKCDNIPVLIYKPQGETSSVPLHSKDFILGIQTPLQAEMLKKFGHNKTICIDATHGTNSYNFSLVTVIVAERDIRLLGAFRTEQIRPYWLNSSLQ